MQALFNQAQLYHQQGQLAQAEKAYNEVLKAAPKHPVVCARLSQIYQQTGRASQAFPLIKVAIAGLPDQFDLLVQGGSLASQLGEGIQAEEWLKHANTLKENDAKILEQLSGVLISNHKEDEALELAKKVIRLDPKNANAYNLKGLALSRLGETEKGYTSFQKALKLNPGLLSVVRNLVLYGKGKKDPLLDKVIPQLESKLEQTSQSAAPQVVMNLSYILFMYYEKKNEVPKAFNYLKMGNDINRAGYQYSHSQTVGLFSQIKKVFDKTLVEACSSTGLSEDGPVFILGMPRSGTTLIEQILSSHSMVESEGEIIDLRQSFDKHPEIMDERSSLDAKIKAVIEIGKSYIDSVRTRQSSPIFTDKMPYNFMMLGAIALALPNAKIIHCTRDPIETCFSIYKQNFAGSHAYTNDLVEVGQYYNEYLVLMKHWKVLFGDRIYEANYESFVEDSENQIDKLLAFCELEKQDACYKFYQNKRAVRTASVAQVRQPIYKDAMKASYPYKEHLQPLIEELSA